MLHFDVRWYTPIFDPKAGNKLNAICIVVKSALPSHVRSYMKILAELFRIICIRTATMYPLVTLEHNDQNCIRSFVKNNVWNRLMDRQTMWFGRKKKPIMFLGIIYNKNQPFRVPGSSNYGNYPHLPCGNSFWTQGCQIE